MYILKYKWDPFHGYDTKLLSDRNLKKYGEEQQLCPTKKNNSLRRGELVLLLVPKLDRGITTRQDNDTHSDSSA